MLRKVVLFFAWLGILILSLAGIIYSIGHSIWDSFPKNFLESRNIFISERMLMVILLIVSWFYLFAVFLKITGKFKKGKNYEIQNENGVLTVSPKVVTDCVKDLLADDAEISNTKIETQKNGKRFDILVKTEMISGSNIGNKSTEIQNKIKRQLSNKMGIDIGEVEVKLSKLINKEKAPEPIYQEEEKEEIFESSEENNNAD